MHYNGLGLVLVRDLKHKTLLITQNFKLWQKEEENHKTPH